MSPWKSKAQSQSKPKWTGQYYFHRQRLDPEEVAQAVSDQRSYHHVDGVKAAPQGSEHTILACVGRQWQFSENSKFG